MVQSGIAYAAGQLLAVVAPRTVLVVDAPTDWSLAGPLWELALDDAPVDEILDVLIRRGIRTAPSFAIVRVENDAVRALVRGSVPVCFERSGEPVRLDATGATTWLEGLISSAKRVLVGDVVSNTPLPYLVSTGVVLVSGLALPCGAEQSDRPAGPATISEAAEPVSTAAPVPAPSAPPVDDPYFAKPSPSPVSPSPVSGIPVSPSPVSGIPVSPSPVSGIPVSASPAPASPVSANPVSASAASGASSPSADRESRVVDLTRSEARSPVGSYAGAAEPQLNGHVPAGPEPAPSYDSPSVFEPSPAPSVFAPSLPGSPLPGSPSSLLATPPSTQESPPESASMPALAEPASAGAPAPAFSSRATSDSRFDPIDFSKVHADDPGELKDLDERDQVSAAGPESAGANFEQDDDEPVATPSSGSSPDPLDDLLIEDDEPPAGPSPADLPSFDPPPLAPSRVGLNGTGVPVQPRRFGAAVSAWPPAAWPPIGEPDQSGDSAELTDQPASADVGPGAGAGAGVGAAAGAVNGSSDSSAEELNDDDAPDAESAAFLPPSSSYSESPPLGELPLRVRGRSLRPEVNRAGLNGNRLLNGQDAPDPEPTPTPTPASSASAVPASGALLLPAFFRGARAARKPDAPDIDLDGPDDSEVGNAAAAWLPQTSGSGAPAPWSPPVRRTFSDPSGFNGGPPAMPGVLRPAGADNPSPSSGIDAYRDRYDEPTERTSGPEPVSPARGGAPAPEALREPPRLLGVWCDAGHVTSPDQEECRVCGLVVPAQAPILVARPPLGVLIFDNGDRVMVDRPVVLGRDPKPRPSQDADTPVLHAVPSATGQVSRTHAEIRASGWDVVLTDLDAMNGTALTLPGASPVAIEPGVPTLITPGARVDLGGESGFVFEVEA